MASRIKARTVEQEQRAILRLCKRVEDEYWQAAKEAGKADDAASYEELRQYAYIVRQVGDRIRRRVKTRKEVPKE